MAEVFTLRDRFEWRGLGEVAASALAIRDAYAAFDAERRYDLSSTVIADHKACECGAILRGRMEPPECRLFATVCTPDNPIGACMVSSEGACAAYYTFGRQRHLAARAGGLR
jgi:hydrogenase expression/formation protein HypD